MNTATEKLAEIATLKQKVLSFPPGYHAQRGLIADLQKQLKPIKDEHDEMWAEAIAFVSAELFDNGKPRYTNDKSRKAAAESRLTGNVGNATKFSRSDIERWATIRKALLDAEDALEEAERGLKRLEDEHRAWRAVVDLTIAEVSLLTAGR